MNPVLMAFTESENNGLSDDDEDDTASASASMVSASVSQCNDLGVSKQGASGMSSTNNNGSGSGGSGGTSNSTALVTRNSKLKTVRKYKSFDTGGGGSGGSGSSNNEKGKSKRHNNHFHRTKSSRVCASVPAQRIQSCIHAARHTLMEIVFGNGSDSQRKGTGNSSTASAANNGNNGSSGPEGNMLYSVYIPLAVPLPRSQVWHHVSKNEKGDEEPNLKYVPYFGDDDVTGIECHGKSAFWVVLSEIIVGCR
jgi:hypothetical protein